MTFTSEELNSIDLIKYHIKRNAESQGVEMSEPVTDKLAIQYALAITAKYVQELHNQQIPKKKGIKNFLTR